MLPRLLTPQQFRLKGMVRVCFLKGSKQHLLLFLLLYRAVLKSAAAAAREGSRGKGSLGNIKTIVRNISLCEHKQRHAWGL